MYAYIKGRIEEQTSNQIILENNNIGYEITVSNPYILFAVFKAFNLT